jgi:hypothetical protein
MEYARLCMSMRLGNARHSAIAGGSGGCGLWATGAASGRGIVNPARCLVTVYRCVSVSGRVASSARSAGRAICGLTGMARSGPAPGVTSSCRAVKAASWPRGPRPAWDGSAGGGPGAVVLKCRPVPAGGCRLGPRIVTILVPRCRSCLSEAEAPLATGPARWRIWMAVCRIAGSQLGSQR